MYKIIFVILLFIQWVIVYPENVNATEDYIPINCEDMRFDDSSYMICNIAKRYQTPLYMTSSAFMIAGVESTAFYCGFRTNNNFIKIKNKILSGNSRIQNVYQLFIDNSTGNFQNKAHFCQQQYAAFGPNAPRGPNGGDNRLFD